MTGLCSLIDLVLDQLSGSLLARRLESVQTALSAGVVGDAVVFVAIGDVVSGLLLSGNVRGDTMTRRVRHACTSHTSDDLRVESALGVVLGLLLVRL